VPEKAGASDVQSARIAARYSSVREPRAAIGTPIAVSSGSR
jgi:hypothetical protein